MPYTRRSVLRDAALLSLAGATGASPLSLLGQCTTSVPAPRPAAFKSDGIRVFFCGAWLFAADPANPNTRMLAVALDMCPAASPCHKFPHGVWTPDSCFDAGTELSPISANKNKNHQITITNSTTLYSKVDDLFNAALCNNPFTYLPNPAQTYTINTGLDTVRAISLPFPTNIIPAAFVVNSVIDDPYRLLKHRPRKPRLAGVATAHIFEYDGGDSLTLVDGSGTQVGTAAKSKNYHFHTVPVKATDVDHAPAMFQNLLTLITGFTPTDLTLLRNYYPAFHAGPDTPTTIVDEELELKAQSVSVCPGVRNQTLASCASGGGGVGNGGN
jgi:hypothetical protein